MKMYQVDAFTKELFKGNPAAVFVMDEWLDEQLMQNIAMENNLSETAFVKTLDESNYVRELGIFIVSQDADGKIKMNFPIRKAELVSEYPQALRDGLTKPFKAVYRNAQAYIVEYETVQDVLDERPNLEKLKLLGQVRTACNGFNPHCDCTSLG